MGRPTKRQQFLDYAIHYLETEDRWIEFRDAMYKEALISQKTGFPRTLYNHIIWILGVHWDWMQEIDPHHTKEEVITDIAEVLDDTLARRMVERYKDVTAL